jgi:hypothetical protein
MNTTMKLFGTLVISAAVALFAAPTASAFTQAENNYINDLSRDNVLPVGGNYQGMVDGGWSVCKQLSDPNVSAYTVASNVYWGNNINQRQSLHAVVEAMDDLCPQVITMGM